MDSLSRCRNVKKLSHAQLCYFLILNKLEACLGSVEDWNWFGGVQRQQIGIYIKKTVIMVYIIDTLQSLKIVIQ